MERGSLSQWKEMRVDLRRVVSLSSSLRLDLGGEEQGEPSVYWRTRRRPRRVRLEDCWLGVGLVGSLRERRGELTL